MKQKTNDLKKDDPYKVYEHLQLSLEEVCKQHYHPRSNQVMRIVSPLLFFHLINILYNCLAKFSVIKVYVREDDDDDVFNLFDISGIFPLLWTWLSFSI